VNPRAAQLAQQVRDSGQSGLDSLELLAFSFEDVLACVAPGMLEQLVRDCGSHDAAGSIIWIAVSPTAGRLLLEQLNSLPVSVNVVSAPMTFLGIGAGTQEVLDGYARNAPNPDQAYLRKLLQGDQHAWPDAQRMEQMLIDYAQSRAIRPSVRVVRGHEGRVDWQDRLQTAGFEVKSFVTYRRVSALPPHDAQERLVNAWRRSEPTCLVLPSTQAISSMASLLPRTQGRPGDCSILGPFQSWIFDQPVLVPHPRLQSFARELGFGKTRLYRAGTEGLLDALKSASEYH
jgi:uroporphyrinogen-III synthase